METLKPGTKCMSRDSLFGYHTGPLPIPSCGSEAVRFVTVPAGDDPRAVMAIHIGEATLDLPMCSACAEHHERSGK